MKRLFITFLLMFSFSFLSLASQVEENTSSSISYEQNYEFDWEKVQEKIIETTRNGAKKAKYAVISVMGTLFAIQVLIDGMYANVNGNLKGFISGTLIKKGLVFALYVGFVNMILLPINSSGNILGIFIRFINKFSAKFTGVEGFEKISSIWLFGKVEAMKVMKLLSTEFSLRHIGSYIPKMILILIIVAFIYFLIFRIMLEMFMTTLQIFIAGTLSIFFMPLGILDSTKGIWNIGRFYSLLINSGLKLLCINIFLITGMKILEENLLNMPNGLDFSALFSFLIIVYLIYHFITKGVKTIVSTL